jgi:ATP-dependent Clp protease ATP-binding subunit ClpA
MSDLLRDKVQLQALDPERISKDLQTIRTAIHSRIIGQNAAIDSVTDALAVQDARLSNPKRPRLVLLAAGPTGVGKSLLAKTLAWAWLGDEKACTQINCGSMSKANEHYAAGTLLGSASGYVGSDRTPLLSYRNLNSWRQQVVSDSNQPQSCVILFDEIEKASESLWTILLSIMDEGTVTLGDNTTVDLSQSVIVLTCNSGTLEAAKANACGNLGFVQSEKDSTESIILRNIESRFAPEWVNRIDKIIVFRSLDKGDVYEILLLELGDVQRRIVSSPVPFLVSMTDKAKDLLLGAAWSPKYMAREVRRVIDRRVLQPLAKMVTSGQIAKGSVVFIGAHEGKLTFATEVKQSQTIVPVQIEMEVEPLGSDPDEDKQDIAAWFNSLPIASLKGEVDFPYGYHPDVDPTKDFVEPEILS